jgi:hypothetical protein
LHEAASELRGAASDSCSTFRMSNNPFDHLRLDIASQAPVLRNAVDDDLAVANLDLIASKSLAIDDDSSCDAASFGAKVILQRTSSPGDDNR